MQWMFFAFLSAVFAAATSILAKIGIKNVDSNLATAIRTTVILVFTWGIAFSQKSVSQIPNLSKTSVTFLVLSGLATGFSWLFYFRALQLGPASKVVPIDKLSLVITMVLAAVFLKENVNLQVIIGAVLMTIGTLVIALAK
ncbi:MAG: EamA family transporter [Candidatus Pacebacteria bacterium]|jgi:transporter family protein|nr:EamA family transporter [Candidatus Paceibacterota bacterium]